MKNTSVVIWMKIFSLVKSVDSKKPLTAKILSDPNHEAVKTLVYIYSLETFIFSEMNKASRDKDESKIEFYAPLASAMGFIVHSGNIKQT